MGLAAAAMRLARKLVRAQLLAVRVALELVALELAVLELAALELVALELAVPLWLELAWQLVLLKPSVQLASQLI